MSVSVSEGDAPRPASTGTNVPYIRIAKYLGKLCSGRGKNPFYNADIKFWCRSGTWELQKSRRRGREIK